MLSLRLWLGLLRLIPIEAPFMVIKSRLLIVVNNLSLEVLISLWGIECVFLMLKKVGRWVRCGTHWNLEELHKGGDI